MTTDSVSGTATPSTRQVSTDGFSGNMDVMVQMIFLQYNQLMGLRTRSKLDETKKTIENLSTARDMKRRMKELQSEVDPSRKDHYGCTQMPKDMKEWLNDQGIQWDHSGGDDYHNVEDWDRNIAFLDSYMQKTTGMNKTQMIELNQCVEDGNNSLREVSTVFSKYTEMLQSIIQTINR